MHPLYHKIEEELISLKKNSLLRDLDNNIANKIKKPILNLSTNDYLGLATDDKFLSQFLTSSHCNHSPIGGNASRLIGNFHSAYTLEKKIAMGLQKESVLLFNSGYHANTSILPAICSLDKVHIISDKLVHASIIDGITLSKKETWTRFKHNNSHHLEKILEKIPSNETAIIVVESLYSMDGDCTDLHKLVELKKKYKNTLIYLDEAHSFGCYGKNGYGLSEELNVLDEIDFFVATFGKAFSSMGAFIACSKNIRSLLINKSRALIYSTMLPEYTIKWNTFVFEQLPSLYSKREYLHKISSLVRKELIAKDMPIGKGDSHIIPIIIGENNSTCLLAEKLQEANYDVRAIRHPSVPFGTARLRLSLSASMQLDPLYTFISILSNKL